MFFRTIGLFRTDRLCVHYFFLFAFWDTNRDILFPCNPNSRNTCFGNPYFGEQPGGSKYRTWYSEQVTLQLGWRYKSSLHSADGGRNSCPLLWSCFIGSCHVWCLKIIKRLSRSISPQAFYCPPIIPLSLLILRRRGTDNVNPELCLKLQSEIMWDAKHVMKCLLIESNKSS